MQRIAEDSRRHYHCPRSRQQRNSARRCQRAYIVRSIPYGVLGIAVGPVGRDADALLFQQSAGTTEFQHWLPQILANRQNQAPYSVLRRYYVLRSDGFWQKQARRKTDEEG
jgi:hypothetical protein